MRLTLRTLAALVVIGANVQVVIGQGGSKSQPLPSSTSSAATSSAATSSASSAQPSPSATFPSPPPDPPNGSEPGTGESPDAVGGMAYAFDGRSLFIQGGQRNGGIIEASQFFSLNLTLSWQANQPIWNRLPPPPDTITDPAGGLTTYNQFLLVGNQGSKTFGYTYDTGAQKWDKPEKEDLNNSAAGSVIASSKEAVFILDRDGFILTLDSSFAEKSKTSSFLNTALPSALSWSISNNSLLMTYTQGSNLAVGMFKPGDAGPKLLTTTGAAPSARTGHCFVPNGNGSTYYVFGGASTPGPNFLNDIYSFDVKTAAWSTLKKSTPVAVIARSKMSCVVQGDTLVVWGGFTNPDNTVADPTVRLYDITGQRWKDNFTALPNNGNTGGGLNPAPGPDGQMQKGGSNLGPIIGGVAGGLAVVALVVGFFIFRRRKARNTKSGIQVLQRNGPATSNGKNPGGQVNVSIDEYTTIPSPFASEDTTPPLYAAPPLHPISAPLMNQNKPGPLISQQMQFYSAPSQVPPIPARPTSGSPTAPKIQSPFEVEAESSVCLPLLPVSSGTPISSSLGGLVPGSYHSQGHVQGDSEGRTGGAFSPSMEAAMTVDLIPIEAGEAGDGDNEPEQDDEPLRTTTVVSSRGMPSAPERAKSRSHGPGDKTLLEDDAGGRRDSTETLEYLEIS